ncbi:MAG TPA: PilX N-terminal domain-containing pilus assembly protein [Candidatus Competibacteraceae bacterium]|nr:PilX N-terminal domain-containing pilus assembly protein [Candidatus Competibacteraceae bacterium]
MFKLTSVFNCKQQKGAALIVALVFLLIMTMIGATAMQSTTQQEKMAGNTRQRNLAFQAAEAALRDGEGILQQATLPTFDGSTAGLIQPMVPTTEIGTFWMGYNWTQSQTYSDTLDEVSAQPSYVIEELPRVAISGGSVKFGPLPEAGLYRVTARGLGGTTDAIVILQTTYRR